MGGSIISNTSGAIVTIGGKKYLRITSDGVPVEVTFSDDTSGSTIHISGTATTTPTDYPVTAANDITLALVTNLESKKTRDLEFSFDGGVTFSTLKPGSFVGWAPKGDITQIKIKRAAISTVDVSFEIMINRKP